MTRAKDADLVWTVTDEGIPGSGETFRASHLMNVQRALVPSHRRSFFSLFRTGPASPTRTAETTSATSNPAAQPSLVIGRVELHDHSNPSSKTMLSNVASVRSKIAKTRSIVSPGTTGALVVSHFVPA